MADFSFKVSPNIVLGTYATSRIGASVLKWGARFMLIVDPILKETGIAEKITKALDDKKVEYFVFDQLSDGADTEVLSRAMELAKQSHIHGVIACGGGKSISVARTLCAYYNDAHTIYDLIDGATPNTAPLPLICIPTTIRDAFLFTDTIPLIDARTSTIKLLKVQNGLCKLAVFDPNHISTLSENQLESMSLETLCLATEAYLSQRENFFSDMIAEKAVELLGYALNGSPTLTITTPKEELLCQGGCMASLAAATSSVGMVSLLTMTISARYGISRALVSTILFPYMIEECAKYKTARLAKLGRILGLAKPDQTDEEIVQAFAEDVRQKIAKANLPARLKDLSISLEQLALAAEDSGQLELSNSLPRSMTSDDLFSLIKTAF
ncbi:MAG: iron-containing alcohol dehydrogenase [Treponema sp.]|nr:iron-containing alcohol dehydrogenase [Candidatus Treponema equifaecale]